MQRMPPSRARAGAVFVAVLAGLVGACGGGTDATEPPLVTGDPPTARVPIIVDTDVDVSDIAALAVLLRDPHVDVRAITIAPTGTGVTNCDSGRQIVGYVLEEFGAGAIPFACGRADPGPDGRRFPDEWRLNADEGWGMEMPPPSPDGRRGGRGDAPDARRGREPELADGRGPRPLDQPRGRGDRRPDGRRPDRGDPRDGWRRSTCRATSSSRA